MIAKHYGEGKKQATARSIYLALTQIASDEKSERFQKPVAYIAMIAGISARSLQQKDMLPKLEQLGLVKIDTQFENGGQIASLYTILRIEAPAQKPHHPPAESAPPSRRIESEQTAVFKKNGFEKSLEPSRSKSIWELKTIKEAKVEAAKTLKDRHCSESAMDEHWDNETKRQEYRTLKKQIKELTEQIAKAA